MCRLNTLCVRANWPIAGVCVGRSIGEALGGENPGGFWQYRVGDYRLAQVWDAA